MRKWHILIRDFNFIPIFKRKWTVRVFYCRLRLCNFYSSLNIWFIQTQNIKREIHLYNPNHSPPRSCPGECSWPFWQLDEGGVATGHRRRGWPLPWSVLGHTARDRACTRAWALWSRLPHRLEVRLCLDQCAGAQFVTAHARQHERRHFQVVLCIHVRIRLDQCVGAQFVTVHARQHSASFPGCSVYPCSHSPRSAPGAQFVTVLAADHERGCTLSSAASRLVFASISARAHCSWPFWHEIMSAVNESWFTFSRSAFTSISARRSARDRPDRRTWGRSTWLVLLNGVHVRPRSISAWAQRSWPFWQACISATNLLLLPCSGRLASISTRAQCSWPRCSSS